MDERLKSGSQTGRSWPRCAGPSLRRRRLMRLTPDSGIDARPLAAEFAVGHREECEEKIELHHQACRTWRSGVGAS
jgi:hypothetical protein